MSYQTERRSPNAMNGQWSRQKPGTNSWEDYVEGGRKIQLWIADPNEPGCKVSPISLTLDTLRQQGWSIRQETGSFPAGCTGDAVELGIPYVKPEEGRPDKSSLATRLVYTERDDIHASHRWQGKIAKGAAFVTNIERSFGASSPFISELIKAVYEDEFPLDTLRHIFFHVVVNEDTSHLIRRLLYTRDRGLEWPDRTRRHWEISTPEYQALLGSRIGKVAGYFIIGAFPRGTRQISRIVCWAGILDSITLRFDLEDIEIP
ncbi:hypothetical protein PENSTE_c002G08227 [Penicillium steckii]|uniref:Uncharacterized protein n=1 Tax=Penicillium steckii TaxID=303698 RepID=A0A1V6TUD5_9EURO|nr:hypothetical protein PENSTE_c002G08227 [Penicillium steckii]